MNEPPQVPHPESISPRYHNTIFTTPLHVHQRNVNMVAGTLGHTLGHVLWEIPNQDVIQPMYRNGQLVIDVPRVLLDPYYQPNNPYFRRYIQGDMSWWNYVGMVEDATVAVLLAESGYRMLPSRGASHTAVAPATGRPPLQNPVTGETMEIIPPRQRVNRIDPTAPNPVRPSDATMGGRPFPTWGRDHVGWGTGPEGALDRISTITRQELLQQGVTREQVIAARDFYMAEFRQNAGNQSAAARVQLMNHILTLLP